MFTSTPVVVAERVAIALLRCGFWAPLAICTYLAFAPSPPEQVSRISDVLLHGFAFTYLTVALGLAHQLRGWWRTGGWMVAYGVAIEVVQSFEPTRTAELKDVAVDCLGVGAGLVILWLIGERVRRVSLQITRVLLREA